MQRIHRTIQPTIDADRATLKGGRPQYEGENLLQEQISSKEAVIERTASYFGGAVRWHSPRVMLNVTPPPLLTVVAAQALSSLYNPNLAWDIASGNAAQAELDVIRTLATLAGWDVERAGGAFVFGGKGTNLYGIRAGVRKAAPEAQDNGVPSDLVVLSTTKGHPCHIVDTELSGIGRKRCIRVPVGPCGYLEPETLDIELERVHKAGQRVATIILTGGSTIDLDVDPIGQLVEVRDDFVKRHELNYKPHIHIDAVVGWPWLFFASYDWEINPMALTEEVAERLKRISSQIATIDAADSFGADFHKTGFCPYASSIFMIKDRVDFGMKSEPIPSNEYSAYTYTIENSRPGQAAIGGAVALYELGTVGFRSILAKITETALYMRKRLASVNRFVVHNSDTPGFASVFTTDLGSNELNEQATRAILSRCCEENHYLIDILPAMSTGTVAVKTSALKTYICTPNITTEDVDEFIEYICKVHDVVTGIGIGPVKLKVHHPLAENTNESF